MTSHSSALKKFIVKRGNGLVKKILHCGIFCVLKEVYKDTIYRKEIGKQDRYEEIIQNSIQR